MRSSRRVVGWFVMLFLGALSCQGDLSSKKETTSGESSATSRSPPSRRRTLREVAAAQGGHVTSEDRRGVPQFIWAVGTQSAPRGATPGEAATHHLLRFARAHGLREQDLKTAELAFVRTVGNRGVLARWEQRLAGVEVYPSRVTVLMRANLDLVAISGNLRALPAGPNVPVFHIDDSEALARALATQLQVPLAASDVVAEGAATGNDRRFRLKARTNVQLPEPARVKRILYANDEELEAAYFIEFYATRAESTDSQAFRYILSARDGSVLERRNLTASDAFTYRVWAEPGDDLRPMDGPTADFTPHPSGSPDGTSAPLVPATLITVEGLNAGPLGTPDPWLTANAQETSGNNVDAYSDVNAPDGYSNADFRATVTSARMFDRSYDFNAEPASSETQTMAAVTALFYVTNWLHDWWYDSGFDEAAGNAQRDNFGRGGAGGDPLRAEAQDSYLTGSRDNANMSTPSDGMSPRLQVFVWSGGSTHSLTVSGFPELESGLADFGPANFDLTGDLVLVDDGVADVTDACSPPVNNLAGRIALVFRGGCNFTLKAQNVQAAGAVGMIVANVLPGPAPALGGTDQTISIPVLSCTQNDGNALVAALQQGALTARLYRFTAPEIDGALDNTLLAHEYGHFLHHRLSDCGAPQCLSISEGWGDFVALLMTVREGDNLAGAYTQSAYAGRAGANATYFGIRRVPYSTHPAVNALRFRHISDAEALPGAHPVNQLLAPNSEMHNSGEIWASMMFDAYVALLQQVGPGGPTFNEVRRRMSDYVVAGMQLAPRNATFTEARDAVLAAAAAVSATDLQLMAQAFAGRGAGTCAVSPPRDSVDNAGVVEGYTVAPQLVVRAVELVENLRSCDDDGALDGDERGEVVVDISNVGPSAASGASLTLGTTTAGITFPSGEQVLLEELAPYTSRQVRVEIAADASLTGVQTLDLALQLDAPGACTSTVSQALQWRINHDETGGATDDDVEAATTPWTRTGTSAEGLWSRTEVTALDHAWVGLDQPGVSDTALESPALQVSTTEPFVVAFDHRFSFEADESTFWDGGVLEISVDGGAWTDVSMYVDPGYVGALTDTSSNPLALRNAFSGNNTSWPARDRLTLDFGTALGGQSVRIRFRVGTDLATGAYGWEIDNLSFQGITNAPFLAVVEDAGACPVPLLADAGPDVVAEPGALVVLDGSGSVSAEGLPLTFSWVQTAGPPVSLVNADRAQVALVAPVLEEESVLTLELTVDDGTEQATDSVTVTVAAVSPPVLVARGGGNQTVLAGAWVFLDGSDSTTTGATPLSFSWTQTGGPGVTLTNASGAVASFSAPFPETDATLTFQLEVSDGAHRATTTVEVVVRGYALSASAGTDGVADAGALITLDGSGSASSTNLPLTFTWTQTAGPPVTIRNDDAAVATVVAPRVAAATTLTFQLTVSDGQRETGDTADVLVRAYTLTARAGADSSVEPGMTVTLDGSPSRSSTGLPLTFSWTQTAGPTVGISDSTAAVASFSAPSVDADTTLSFQLTVSDGTDDATDTVDILVRGSTLSASAGTDQTVNADATVVLDGSASQGSSGRALTFAWTQTSGPDVTLSSTNSAVTLFTAPAMSQETQLVFRLQVSDGIRTATDDVQVVVAAAVVPVVTADAGKDQAARAEEKVVLDASHSRSSANLPLMYTWTQTAGPAVGLSDPSGVAPSFTAPDVDADTTLTFQLSVSDGTTSGTDEVSVTVTPLPDDVDTQGCTCSTTDDGGFRGMVVLLGVMVMLRRARARRR
ncbi:MAG: M36 family metallopeptidase [Myxococcota bacterium]